MLAKDAKAAFNSSEWIFEIKWDGYRAVAELDGKQVKLYSRNGNSFNNAYPEVVAELAKMDVNAVLDGEIVVLNESGHPDFQKLQHYAENRNFPIQYYVFDLLELNGQELYSFPLIQRKELLADLLEPNDVIRFSEHIEELGEDFFEVAKQKELEGIMAKRKDSQYYPGKRSADWLKIKYNSTIEVIIAGFTEPRGGRKYFGSLVLAIKGKNELLYAGHTGSGFDDVLLKELYEQFEPHIRDSSPFNEKVKTNMPVTWVEPLFVCEVKFTEWTADKKLRHPIFLRMRPDKSPDELNSAPEPTGAVTGEAVQDAPKGQKVRAAAKTKDKRMSEKEKEEESRAEEETPAKSSEQPANEKIYKFGKATLKTTNRNKIFFPGEGITKGDIIDYYESMADIIVPYIKDRPQSLFRTPNGIDQKGFFHKDAGDDAPSWVKHVPVYSDSGQKEIDYILCNDKATLLYLANLGCIEINPWHSQVKKLDNPDYMIIDIDPSDNNTFGHVIEAANVVKEILDKAGVVSVCKTSGASGLHVYVPLGKKYDYEHAKDFANLVCLMATQALPELTTLERSLNKRSKDKIYMDYLQNRRGQTIACAYSVRPKKGATVSAPLLWDEVKTGLTPQQFTIETMAGRLKEKGDLFAPVFDKKNVVDIEDCLAKLSG